MEKEHNLETLKKDYKELQEKHSLPSFKELNEDFNIEKATEVEVDLLIREIRRFVADKLANYMRFIEAILHHVNVQKWFCSIIKALETQEKDKLTEIYKKLSKNELRLIELDIQFSEEKEANFIKDSCEMWQDMKKGIR